jgi:hypothetical protein
VSGVNISLTIDRHDNLLGSRMTVAADAIKPDGRRVGYGIALPKTASQEEIDAAAEKAIARVKAMCGVAA